MVSVSYRSSAWFGKRQEFIAVAELLRCGLDVYMTLVDDQQIDCIVQFSGARPRYIDVQIKARSRDAKQAASFAAMEIREPRENYVFLFYSEACNTYWVFPSLEVVKRANQNKTGKNAGKYRLQLANQNRAGLWVPRPKWRPFEGNFDLLTGGGHANLTARTAAGPTRSGSRGRA